MKMTMKLIKGLALAGAALLFLASCGEKYDEWTPGTPDTGSQFYFSNETETAVTLTPTTSSIDVNLYRVDTSASSDAIVTVSEEETALIIASSPATFNVAFPQGSNVATLSIPVDMNNIDFGKSVKLNLAIAGETTNYAASSLSITATLPEPWKNLGKGQWVDDFACGLYGIDPITVPCTIYENELTPGLFKVEDFQLPLAAAIFGVTEATMKNNEGTYWRNASILINAANPANVTIALQDYGVCVSTGDGFINGITSVYGGKPFSVGTFEDGVISFPTAKGMLCTLSNGQGYYYANQHGKFAVVMPGVVLSDYTIELAFEGILSKGSENSALASVTFVGGDVEEVATAIVKGDDPDAAIKLIEDEDESVQSLTASGSVKFPFAEDAEPGKYTIVAVPVTEEGLELDYAVYETFAFGAGPLELEYTGDDFVAGVAKNYLLATEWIGYATNAKGTAADREVYDTVTFTDLEDVADGEDIILCHGLDYGIGAYYGTFVGDVQMEWYSGQIYTHEFSEVGTYSTSTSTYTVKPVVLDYAENVYGTGKYAMRAAYVDDGIIAFVSNSSTYNWTAIAFGAFDGTSFAGTLTTMNYILLLDPVYGGDEIPAAVKKAQAKLEAGKYLMVKDNAPRNYVELPATVSAKKVVKAPVVASGKVNSTKKTANVLDELSDLR